MVKDFKTDDKSAATEAGLTLNGNAVYIPAGVDSKQFVTKVNLPAGKYKWTYETTVVDDRTDRAGWANMGFGIASAQKTNYYSSQSLISTEESDIAQITNTSSYNITKGCSDGSLYNKDIDKGPCYYYFDRAAHNGRSLQGKHIVTVDITVKQAGTYYLWIAGHTVAQYVENIELVNAKLDKEVYDFENGLDDNIVINPQNQTEENEMRIAVTDLGDGYGDVLSLPKYSGTDNLNRISSARFYKVMRGLEVGKSYKASFDVKIPEGEYAALEWIALVGVSTRFNKFVKEEGKVNNTHFTTLLSTEYTTDDICTLPNKALYKSEEGYSYAADGNNKGVIKYNGGTGWATYSIEFRAESELAFFVFENYAKRDLYVDNIKFEQTTTDFSGALPENCGITKDESRDNNVDSWLIIGNSFGQNTFNKFQNIIDAVTDNSLDLRVGYYGKGAMQAWWFKDQLVNDLLGMDFYYSATGRTGGKGIKAGASVDAVSELGWDHVLIQATTIEYTEWYLEDIEEIIPVLQEKFPGAKIHLYMPWNTRQDYINSSIAGKKNSYIDDLTVSNIKEQMVAIDAYIARLELISDKFDGVDVISVSNELFELQKIIDNIHAGEYGVNDGLHINAIGETAVAMTLFRKLTGFNLEDTEKFNLENSLNISDYQFSTMIKIANGTGCSVYGDANHSGATDIVDLVRMKKVAVNEGNYTLASDLNEDGLVNALDLAKIRSYLLNN